jgi:hypothetical protein
MEHTTYASYSVFQVADWGRSPADGGRNLGNNGNELMHKVMFAAALAVGLITAPVTQIVSTAAAQQQASTPRPKMPK